MSITLTQALDYLNITDQDRYDEIQLLVDTSKYLIEQFLGFNIDEELATTYVIDGTENTEFISLPKPIDLADITSITFDGVAQDLSNFYQNRGNGFFLELDSIYAPTTRRSIEITGDWGVAGGNGDLNPNLLELIQYYIISWLLVFDDEKIISNKVDIGTKIYSLSQQLPHIIVLLLNMIKSRGD